MIPAGLDETTSRGPAMKSLDVEVVMEMGTT